MSFHYDLHSHSTASDGTLSPAELVLMAKHKGVDALALTDHDETGGIAEAQKAAAAVGMQLIPGIEISVSWRHQTIHIVGLNIDPNNLELNQGLTGLREFRDWRAEEIGRRLEKANISGAYEAAKALAGGQIISRTHFAHFLANNGYAKDVRSVFKKYLVRGKPGYVPGQWAELNEAVGWIRAAGGQAVIAHPARYNITASVLRKLIAEFKEAGGEGMEVISGSHSKDDMLNMARHAEQAELKASAGSDYHGPENPWIELGRLPQMPDNCTPIWHDWH